MLESINSKFNAQRSASKANEFFMTEAATEIDDYITDFESDGDDDIDVDSVPDEAFKKADKALDELISSGDYDDEEIEDLVDDDEDVAAKLGEVMDEAATLVADYKEV